MSELPRRVQAEILARSFLVQGSWNYQTLIGTGFAFLLLPALRHIHRGDETALRESVGRHTELFNSHPYLAGIAAGAVARLEADRVDPRTVGRFKSALRGSLGSVGDQLVWLAWRPATALVGMLLLLLGLPWWVAVTVFLAGYNALHLWLRAWGVRVGAREGLNVGAALRAAPLLDWPRRITAAAAVLAGAVAVLFAGLPGDRELITPGAVAVGVAAGLWLGRRARRVAWILLTAVWLVAVVAGAVQP